MIRYMFFNMFVSYSVRMQCTLGFARGRGIFSFFNPGLGPRFLFIDKYNIEVAHRNIVSTVLNIIILV